MMKKWITLMMAAACMTAQGAVVPKELPKPDDQAPSSKKPVKVYILSGQSNMVGFGTLSGSRPAYPSIFLSPDPSVMPCRMPVGNSALLPLKVYQSEAKDAAEGTKVEMVPAAAGSTPSVVKTFIELPVSGAYQLHSGYEESSYGTITLDGKEVYHRNPGETAVVTKVNLEKGRRYPVVISYQNAKTPAFWMELVDLKGKGDLEWVIKDLGIYKCLMDDKGEWTKRSDVTLNDAYLGKGSSTPLTATANGKFIGPELGFGYVMGTFHDEPVLLIKTCIGNRGLAWDYLPPGSERFEVTEKDPQTGADKTYVYAGYKDTQDRWEKGTEPKAGGWYAGKQYDDCTVAVKDVLNNFGTKYPEFKEQGYEIAGFVWWQGHKDTGSDVHAARYEQNMVKLIKAWRKEFKAPNAKFVLATGCGNPGREGRGLTIAEAQLAVDGDSGKHPEFKGNVKTIDSRGFWRNMGESPTGTGYHYNHNAETYLLTGDALGRAMVELHGGKAEPSPGVARPPVERKPWPAKPTPEQAVEMIYSDAFISPWDKDPAKPTPEQMASMAPALRPIILDKIVTEYPAAAAKVPGYLHRGIYLEPIVTGKKPANLGAELGSDLDTLFTFYQAAGIQDYGWKPFGPDMRNATWEYFSFDPAEKADPTKDRYRDITYPAGMENWSALDFNAAKAGWKSASAPFGQNNGKLVALNGRCTNPHCGCGTTPKTLWEKEVLLMRQTFEIPKLDPDRRYRLVVGGSAHTFAGEGFALYVNGKLFAEAKSGYYKNGGDARGGHVFSDFLPEFQGGKVTIALKSFLRQTGYVGQPAPPSGHLSVWMEEARVPEAVLKTYKSGGGTN